MAKALVNKQIDSVGEEERALQLAMIANTKHNPIISDYSTERPSGVKTGDDELQAVGSLDRLNNSNSVSFWDYQTKIWHVRVNFTDSKEMVTEFFQVTAAESSR